MPTLYDGLELIMMPFLSMGGHKSVEFGTVTFWNASLTELVTSNADVERRIRALLAMYRQPHFSNSNGIEIKNMAVVSVGALDFRHLPLSHYRIVHEARRALFLCCLADNIGRRGVNAGFNLVTAENFQVIVQRFALDSDWLSERTGIIIDKNIGGLKIGESRFVAPSHVNLPSQLRFDQELFEALTQVKADDPALFGRVSQASALFLESYYNSHNVDFTARILLQAAAFEALLDLTNGKQRADFKREIAQRCNHDNEPELAYQFDVGQGRSRTERGSRKVIWADRFFALRNLIIHGDTFPDEKYVFEGAQHHLLIAPIFFVYLVKSMLNDYGQAHGRPRTFFERIDWLTTTPEHPFDDEVTGFQINTDFTARFAARTTR